MSPPLPRNKHRLRAPRESHLSPLLTHAVSPPSLKQEGRKKGREFADEYFRVLPKALTSVSRSSDAKLRTCAKRLVDIWDERKVGTIDVKES